MDQVQIGSRFVTICFISACWPAPLRRQAAMLRRATAEQQNSLEIRNDYRAAIKDCGCIVSVHQRLFRNAALGLPATLNNCIEKTCRNKQKDPRLQGENCTW